MSTIKDIAGRTGLGLATISKYINGGNVRDENRIAIESAITELGFTVNEFARGLRTNKSRIIGIVIPELNNLFITTIITVAEDILRRHGYGTIVCDCRTDEGREAEAVGFLLGKRVDGIINMPVSGTGAHLQPAIAIGLPVILIDRMIPAVKNLVGAVLIDNVKASADAVRFLIAKRHTDIGVILGPRDVFTSSQRLLGVHQALVENNMLVDDDLVIYSAYTVQGGYEAMKQLLAGRRVPTAVFVTNYEMTLGAVIAVNELNIQIPKALSLIGFDNMQLSQVIKPSLTIVSQPLEDIGAQAAELLLRALKGGKNEEWRGIITLQAGIAQGASVAALPSPCPP